MDEKFVMGRPSIIDNDSILAKARALFTEYGPNLSTQTIAVALGVSQATLFKRFTSKENLFFSAMTLKPELPALPDGGADAKTYLTFFVAELLKHVESFSPVMMKLMSHPNFATYIQKAHSPDLHLMVSNRLKQVLTVFQQQGQIHATADIAAVVNYLIETLHGHVFMQLMSGQTLSDELTADVRAAKLIAVLWTGLAPEPPYAALD